MESDKMKLTQHGFANNFGLVGKSVRRYLTTTALTATGLMALASPALADNWTDHVADEGSISIDTSVANTTNIKQNTDFVKVHGDGDINAHTTNEKFACRRIHRNAEIWNVHDSRRLKGTEYPNAKRSCTKTTRR